MASDTQSNSSKQDLFVTLQGGIVSAHLGARKAEADALDFAMQAGDRLIEVKQRKLVHRGDWEDFCRETCGSERTAQDYMQLARNRSLIEEAKAQRAALLTLREALALIRKPRRHAGESKGQGSTPSSLTPPPKTLKDWTDDEIRDALSALPFERFVQVIPDVFRPSLAQHAGGQILRFEPAHNPNKRLKTVELKLVHSVEEAPPTTH
jgi:hypothetical protein